MSIAAGMRLGSYEILRPLGQGGMGQVWSARHVLLGRAAAVKFVRPEALGSASEAHAKTVLRRFEREARVTSLLRSPHTVQVYDFGVTDDGTFYYVMELLEGRDLDALVRRHGPLPAGRVIYILQQVCESLAEAHRSGLVHRDIKPENILLTEVGFKFDFAKVLDFGLVLHTPLTDWPDAAETRLTQEGIVAGTPAFMAPEMIQGVGTVDGRADLYSLGCVAYWLLTGQLVFADENALKVVAAHLTQTPEPPSSRCELQVPDEVERVVMKCLEKEPALRYPSAEALAQDLAACPVSQPWAEEQAALWWQLHYPKASKLAAVEPALRVGASEPGSVREPLASPTSGRTPVGNESDAQSGTGTASSGEFSLPNSMARKLFLITQAGYLAMYFAVLFQAEALHSALNRVFLIRSTQAVPLVVAFVMCSIAVRLYLLTSVGLKHPEAGAKFRRLFPVLLLLDGIWAAAPLLLVGKLGLGLPLFGVAALAYLPFSQRTLMRSLYPSERGASGLLRI